MTQEEIAKAVQEELKTFKENLGSFVSPEGLTKAFADFKEDITKMYGEAANKADFAKLEEAMKKQGEALQSMQVSQNAEKRVSFKDKLTSQKEALSEMAKNGGLGCITIPTTNKDVLMSNVGSDTSAYRETMVGQIQRGTPFMRDLFNVVQLGSNSHDTVRWFEQLVVANNATLVGEKRTVGSASNVTWVEKNLSGKRIFDWLKVSIDSLKDIDFINGEVQRLVSRNMMLKENDQLINGTGIGLELAGINTYAVDFVTTGFPKIKNANLVDLLGKIKTQIAIDMLGGATPNYWVANPTDVDGVRFGKTDDGAYLFPQWAVGGNVAVSGMTGVENALQGANTLLAGDFSLGTIYVWDDLMIEIAQIEDDKKTGMTTIMAYKRENLRVQDVDKKAFVKIASISDTLAAIDTTVA